MMKPNNATIGVTATDADLKRRRSRLAWVSIFALLLWFLPYSDLFLYPLRLFLTFIHESGHALAALLTGGVVLALRIAPDGSGQTLTAAAPGDWATRWIVLSAGYVGAAAFGGLMLQTGRIRAGGGRAALRFCAWYILIVTLLWAHNPLNNLFTLVVGVLLAVGLAAFARYASPAVSEFFACFLAVQCCLNAVSDLHTLFVLTGHNAVATDALFMQQAYLLPARFWALIWCLTAAATLYISLRGYWRGTVRRKS